MLSVLRERAVVTIRGGGSFGTRDSEVYIKKWLILYGGKGLVNASTHQRSFVSSYSSIPFSPVIRLLLPLSISHRTSKANSSTLIKCVPSI